MRSELETISKGLFTLATFRQCFAVLQQFVIVVNGQILKNKIII